MLIGILAVLSMIAIAKAIYWKLCFQGVLLYIAECGNPLPKGTWKEGRNSDCKCEEGSRGISDKFV